MFGREKKGQENKSGFSPSYLKCLGSAASPARAAGFPVASPDSYELLQFLNFEQSNPQVETHFHLLPFNELCVLLCFVF